MQPDNHIQKVARIIGRESKHIESMNSMKILIFLLATFPVGNQIIIDKELIEVFFSSNQIKFNIATFYRSITKLLQSELLVIVEKKKGQSIYKLSDKFLDYDRIL